MILIEKISHNSLSQNQIPNYLFLMLIYGDKGNQPKEKTKTNQIIEMNTDLDLFEKGDIN